MRDWLQKHTQLITALIMTVLFLVANFIALSRDSNFLILLPLAGLVLLLFIMNLEQGMMLMALLTPFAINMEIAHSGMELSVPVEPMMILFSLMFLFRVLIGHNYDRQLLRHPIYVVVLLSLGWMLLTVCTSQLPWISVKYLIARLWFVIPFFFAGAQIFSNPQRIREFFWAYAIGLISIIAISTIKTTGGFSDLQTLHRVMRPFYNDHTAYGCVIALFVPAAFYFIFSRGSKGWSRLFFLALFALLLVGFFFSYCRAAWISIVAAIGVYVLIRLGMKVRWMVLLACLGISMFVVYQGEVLYKLGKNHQDSSYDLRGQLESIGNISTDASNLERLNRWASAIRLWKEHPVLGMGPGTYQFLYASYQRSYQLSDISTNNGDLGNAHSEYLGPLTEQGVPGAALVLALFVATFATGVHVYRTAKDETVANMALAFTLSLLTYYVHGVFNNFLNTDKLSVPFWGFTAIILALDVYYEKKTPEPEKSQRKQIAVRNLEK